MPTLAALAWWRSVDTAGQEGLVDVHPMAELWDNNAVRMGGHAVDAGPM